MVRRLLVVLLLCLPSFCQQFALQNGDVVVFFGDSITEQRLYTSYVEQYVLTRYPQMKVRFINSGWGGDETNSNPCEPCHGVGALPRIERDVIAHKPTVVTLLFGMNDGEYQDFEPTRYKRYQDGMAEIIRRIKVALPQARIYVMTPTAYDGTRHTSWSHTDKYNQVLDRYSAAAKEIAAKEKLAVIDLHTATSDALKRAKQADPNYTIADDGVHPGPDGQAVMAAEILRAWGTPTEGFRTQAVYDPKGDHTAMVEAPLPWPGFTPSKNIRDAFPMLNDIGAVTLMVSGVPDGSYSLTVDGSDAGSVTAKELAAGIRVSDLSRSAQKESADIAQAVRQKEDLEFFRWRSIAVPYSGVLEHTETALGSLDQLSIDLTNQTRTRSKLHHYSLSFTRK